MTIFVFLFRACAWFMQIIHILCIPFIDRCVCIANYQKVRETKARICISKMLCLVIIRFGRVISEKEGRDAILKIIFSFN